MCVLFVSRSVCLMPACLSVSLSVCLSLCPSLSLCQSRLFFRSEQSGCHGETSHSTGGNSTPCFSPVNPTQPGNKGMTKQNITRSMAQAMCTWISSSKELLSGPHPPPVCPLTILAGLSQQRICPQSPATDKHEGSLLTRRWLSNRLCALQSDVQPLATSAST